MELGRIDPGLREEVEVLGEFLFEPIQVYSERAFPADVVHSEKVIGSLPVGETREKLRSHSAISPEDVPIVRILHETTVVRPLSVDLDLLPLELISFGYCLFS